MTRAEYRAVRDVLWQVMVATAEALNDATVLGQRKAFLDSARRIRCMALEVAAVAEAILVLSKGVGR